MKAIVCRFFILIVTLLGVMNAFAAPAGGPPPPTEKGSLATANSLPGLPIDEDLFVLLIIAVLFGICVIYRHRLKTKAPI